MMLFVSTANADSVLTEMEFTKLFADRYASMDEVVTVEIRDTLLLDVFDPEEGSTLCNLHNAFLDYRFDPESLDEVIAQYIECYRSIPDADGDSHMILENVVPLVRGLQQTLEIQQSGPIEFMKEALNEELCVVYVIDDLRTMSYLTEKEFSEMDMRLEELRAKSISNLQRILSEMEYSDSEIGLTGTPPIAWSHEEDKVVLLSAGGTYESSLLLIDEIWSKEFHGISGDIVVAVPARDMLMACSATDIDAIGALKKMTAAAETMPYFISDKLFVRRGNYWKLFDPEE